ncbi:MAG: hypothetical protein IM534_04200, partial [Chitinophagaceae bacterium]|nr:hypothetical protein [Chitinophagaceae bacterium]
MKQLLSATFFVLLLATMSSIQSCSSSLIPSRPKYTIVSDTETVVMKGALNRATLDKEPAFTWMTENRKYGSADAGAVKIFSEKKDQFTL